MGTVKICIIMQKQLLYTTREELDRLADQIVKNIQKSYPTWTIETFREIIASPKKPAKKEEVSNPCTR